MCKTALDGPVDPLTEAFNVSSLFLMATPYTVSARSAPGSTSPRAGRASVDHDDANPRCNDTHH